MSWRGMSLIVGAWGSDNLSSVGLTGNMRGASRWRSDTDNGWTASVTQESH